METHIGSWYKKWWGIALIIFAVFMLSLGFAFVLFVFNLAKTINTAEPVLSNTGAPALTAEQQSQLTGSDSYWIGSANPRITIIEFGDFACSYCESAFPTIREISVKYSDKVKYVFRDYPALGENSVKLALAGRCAGEQGLFWLMHDKLFQNQGLSETSELVALANQIGADTLKFENCLSSQKYINQVQSDFAYGQELEIAGTPTWFINGYKIEGDIPHDIFINIIEELINDSN